MTHPHHHKNILTPSPYPDPSFLRTTIVDSTFSSGLTDIEPHSSDLTLPIDPSLLPHPYDQSFYHFHHTLPPPYAPIDYTPQPSSDPILSEPSGSSVPFQVDSRPVKRARRSSRKSTSQNQAINMVYPPPAPHQSQTPPSDEGRGVSLPSMGSWAPPPPVPSPRSVQASPGWGSGPPPMNLPGWSGQNFVSEPVSAGRGAKRDSTSDRRPSGAEEVEAGLALAGLGLGLTAGEMKARRDSVTKKAKKEEERPATKDGKRSCSECRRLKAKCDRVFPCSNCRRRGCALVCPDGDLSCMQGKRLVLASTEQLHERIAQLESALSQSQANHPLLAPEYLDGGFAALSPPNRPVPQMESPSEHRPYVPDYTNSRSPKDRSSNSSFTIATPHMVTDRPSTQGRMAVESLLLSDDAAAPEGKREDEWVGENAAPAMIVGTVGSLTSDEGNDRHLVVERLKRILRVLPPREEMRRRAEGFWLTSTWYNTILRRDEFDAVYEPAVYAPTPANPLSPHKLACVLIVCTLEAYFDLSSDDENPSIGEYWEGVQKCFDTRFGWAASVAGVQALALATLFVGFGYSGARASSFYWLRQMTSAMQQLGLHKDPHVSLPEDERELRRRVFEEAFMLDCLVCLTHGQRNALPLENVETLPPLKDTTHLQAKKYEYARMVKSRVIEVGCRPDSDPASWTQILAIDEHVMSVDVTSLPEVHCPSLLGGPPPPLASDPAHFCLPALCQCATSMCHYKAMMFLYRPSLRRLIARLRKQPPETISLDDQDRQTISRTYLACHSITATSLYMARTHPRLAPRCWSLWIQTFSAAVSMAALAIWCSPHLEATFANSAYGELSEACDTIKAFGSKRSTGVLLLLPILTSLVTSRYPQVEGRDPGTANPSLEGEDMLFALLGGQVDQKSIPAPKAQVEAIQQQGVPTVPPPAISNENNEQPRFVESFPSAEWHVDPAPPTTSYTNPDAVVGSMGSYFMDSERGVEDMDATELWARLQTFYEPSTTVWGSHPGFVDYVTALGSMGMS